MDISKAVVQVQIGLLIRHGEMEYVGKYKRTSIIGSITPVPHYRLLKKSGNKKG